MKKKPIVMQHQPGQSIPLLALMLAALFMLVGLGIDGGLFYAQRRLMQNTADAACLAAANRLALGETSTDAQAAAQAVITANLGTTPGAGENAPGTLNYADVRDLYSPLTGSGIDLSRGIELRGPEVRVALQSPAFTYFVRLLGQAEYTVTAHARCDATAGGGGTPFAIARWRAYRANNNTVLGGLSTDLDLQNQNLTNGNSGRAPALGEPAMANHNAPAVNITPVAGWRGPGVAALPTPDSLAAAGRILPVPPAQPPPTRTAAARQTATAAAQQTATAAAASPTNTTTRTPPPTATSSSGGQPYIVRDVLAQYRSGNNDPSIISQWPGWGSSDYPGSPNDLSGLFSQPDPAANPANPGIEIPLAGNDARANVGNGFRGQVLLDWRNITSGGQFYGGMNPERNPNTYKDVVTNNIVNGYSGPWIPAGTQLGFTDGVSAGQVERPFAMRYQVGDSIAVLVYNGTVYQDADFGLEQPAGAPLTQTRPAPGFNNPLPANCDVRGSEGAYMFDASGGVGTGPSGSLVPLQHSLTVRSFQGNANNPSPYQGSVRLRTFASLPGERWNDLQLRWAVPSLGLGSGGWGPVDGNGFAPVYPATGGINAGGENGRSFVVDLQQRRTASCNAVELVGGIPITTTYSLPVRPAQGSGAIYVESEDTGTNLRRGRYLLMRSGPGTSNDFYAYISGLIAYAPIARATSTTIVDQPVLFETTNGNQVPFNQLSFSYSWFENGSPVSLSSSDLRAEVVDNKKGPLLRISVGSNAPVGRNFHVRVAVTRNGDSSRTQWLWYYVRVRLPVGNSNNVDRYVYTLGYANYRVTRIDSNAIYGVAISGLLQPGDTIASLQPRLLPWED